MAGGSTSTNQNYNPEMQFAPNMDGGALNVGGSVFMGNANFGGESTASGATTGMNLGLNFDGMGGNMGSNMGGGAPVLMLINLADLPQPKEGMGKFDYIDENTVGYVPGDQFRKAEQYIRKYVPAENINEKEWERWH